MNTQNEVIYKTHNTGIYSKYIKRLIDFILALIGLIILSPLLIVIAIIIKVTSPGPVFFKQERIGYHQQAFKIYKFRSMCVNAEFMGDGIRARDDDDPRITKIGKFIRKTSIDELPQLINVVVGDMALVGPRPPVTYHPIEIGEYPEPLCHRFDVRPGVTGLAQAAIRNQGEWADRFVYDLKYVEDVTFLKDVKIIFATFSTVAKLDE